jgi:hypothetical protein
LDRHLQLVPPKEYIEDRYDQQNVSAERRDYWLAGLVGYNHTMPPSTYLFIDGRHLQQHYAEAIRQWFGEDGKIDFHQIKDDYAYLQCFIMTAWMTNSIKVKVTQSSL